MTKNTRTQDIRELTPEEIASVAGGGSSSSSGNPFASFLCFGLGFATSSPPVSQIVSMLLGLNCGCRS